MARERIKIDPEIMVGKPVIRGTRVPVDLVLCKLGAGMAPEEIIADHPKLTLDDVRAAQTFAIDYPADEEIVYRERSFVRWLVDECVDAGLVDQLRAVGHEVAYVAEVVPGVTDPEVLRRAREEDRSLLTEDWDAAARQCYQTERGTSPRVDRPRLLRATRPLPAPGVADRAGNPR